MSLKARITEDVKLAMKAGDKTRLQTLRMLTAAIKQWEVDERNDPDDARVLAIIEKMIKQRRESAEQYRAGGREELAELEDAEAELLATYLPEPLSEADLDTLIAQTIESTGASAMGDMGRVMGELKPRVQGRADMKQVSAKVRDRLAG